MRLWFVLLLFAVLGAYCVDLTGHELWFDDSFSVYMAQQPVSELLFEPVDVHPPGYYLFLKVWIFFYGSSLWGLRFLHILAGVLGGVICYYIGKLWGSGYLMALVWLFSGSVYFYSREVRMYIFVMLFGLMAVYHASRYIHKFKRFDVNMIWFWSLLAFGFHYYGILVLIPAYALIYGHRKILPRPEVLYWPVICLYAVYVFSYFVIQASQAQRMWTQPITANTYLSTLSFMWFVPQNASHLPQWTWYGVFIIFFVVFYFFISLNFVTKDRRWFLFWSLYPVMPVLFMLLSLFIDAYHHRYTLMFLPVPYLCLAMSLRDRITKTRRWVWFTVLLALILCGSALLHTADPNSELQKSTSFVNQYSRPGDVVVHETLYSLVPARYYNEGRLRQVVITSYRRADLFSLGGNAINDSDYFSDVNELKKELCRHESVNVFYYQSTFDYLYSRWIVSFNGLDVRVSKGGDHCT